MLTGTRNIVLCCRSAVAGFDLLSAPASGVLLAACHDAGIPDRYAGLSVQEAWLGLLSASVLLGCTDY